MKGTSENLILLRFKIDIYTKCIYSYQNIQKNKVNHLFSPLSFFSRFSSMISVIFDKSTACFHPQSFLASVSSMEFGQLSAMFCRESGSYVTYKYGFRFLISSASSLTLKLMAAKLYAILFLILSSGASMMSIVPLIASSMYIMGSLVYYLTKHVYFPFKMQS